MKSAALLLNDTVTFPALWLGDAHTTMDEDITREAVAGASPKTQTEVCVSKKFSPIHVTWAPPVSGPSDGCSRWIDGGIWNANNAC